MTKILICTGADHNYFPMLRELIHSIKRFPQAAGIEFAVLDTGLTEEDRAWLKNNVQHVHAPDWPCELPVWKTKGREYLKSCVCRPWINTYFPGYDLYIWMDADTWLQTWDGLALFIEGAQRDKLAVSGQVDRCYPRSVRIKWFGPIPLKLRGFYFSNAKLAFGLGTAKKLYPFHVLQAGVFAVKASAPHWARWQELVLRAVKKGKVFTAEQLCMGVMCHLENYPAEVLPAWTNWLCENLPLWDEDRKLWVEPMLPHQPISILHISGFDELRKNRSVQIEYSTLSGKKVQGTIRYPELDGETDKPIMA